MKIITLTAQADPKAVQKRLQAVGLWTTLFESEQGQSQLLVSASSAPVPLSSRSLTSRLASPQAIANPASVTSTATCLNVYIMFLSPHKSAHIG